MRRVNLPQDIDGVPDADDEWLAEFAQFIRHIPQAVAQESEVSVGDIGLPPQVGLDDVEWENEARAGSLGERRVIGDPQVTLEPHDVERFSGSTHAFR